MGDESLPPGIILGGGSGDKRALHRLGPPRQTGPQASTAEAVRALLSRNLKLLAEYHVKIAVGSDRYRLTTLPEAMGLHGLNVFDNLTLLKMWCEATRRAVFPKRRIGRLKEGLRQASSS